MVSYLALTMHMIDVHVNVARRRLTVCIVKFVHLHVNVHDSHDIYYMNIVSHLAFHVTLSSNTCSVTLQRTTITNTEIIIYSAICVKIQYVIFVKIALI